MTGDVTINNNDAFDTWGINFEDGALSALMTPAPNKDYVESKSRLQAGKTVFTQNAKVDSRELQLPFHIVAKSKAEFFEKYNNFCNDVLAYGSFTLASRWQQGVKYHLVYNSCSQFTQFGGVMALFVLRVTEPNPTNRT